MNMRSFCRRLILLGCAAVALCFACNSDSRTGVALSMKLDSSAAALAPSIAALEFSVTGDETFVQDYSFSRAPFADGEERVVIRLNAETRSINLTVHATNAAGMRILSASVGPIAIANQKLSAANLLLLMVADGADMASNDQSGDFAAGDASVVPDLTMPPDMAVNVPGVAFAPPFFGSMTFGSAKALLPGDYNRDGRVDFVWLAGDNKIHILLGSGSGDFVDSDQAALVGSNIAQLRAADFNGDGATDLAWLSLNAGFYVMLNRGDAAFEPAVFYARSGAAYFDIAFLSPPSRPEIVLSTGTTLFPYRNNGLGTFMNSFSKNTTVMIGYFCLGDMDASGAPDVIVPGHNSDTLVYRANSQGFSEPDHNSFADATQLSECVTGDFTGDGKVDVATTGTNTIVILPGLGSGLLAMPVTSQADYVESLLPFDFNDDGILDVIANLHDGIQLVPYRNQGTGQFTKLDTILFRTPYDRIHNAVFADFNNDNKTDIAWVDRSRLGVQISGGNGAFGAENILIPGGEITAFALGGFGMSNAPFSIVAARTVDATVNMSPGCSQTDGLNMALKTFAVGSQPSALLFRDIDKDNIPDLFVANKGNGTITFFRGLNSDEYLELAGGYTLGLAPVALGAGDFTSDGKLDVVIANQDSNYVSLLRQETGASGTFFQGAGSFPLNASPVAMAVVDFDNDGKLDVLTALKDANQIGLLKGNGTSFAAVQTVNLPAGAMPVDLQTGDFTNDGKADLLVMSGNLNRLYILAGQGDGTFSIINNLPVAQPGSMTTGDWNKDGNLDVVASSTSQRRLLVYLGGGNGFFSAPLPLATVGAAFNLRSYPYAGSAKDDILGIVGNYCVQFQNNTP